jgi:hypothetical protein
MAINKTGGATSGMEYSPARAKRKAAARKGQERRWAAKAGPVEVRKIEPKDAPTA